MPAGRRDQRIRFQRHGATADGYGGTAAGWTDVGAVTMARIRPVSGGERFDAGQTQARTLYEVTIPNRRDIDAAMRIKWLSNGEAILNVRDMADPGARPVERTLIAELAGPERA